MCHKCIYGNAPSYTNILQLYTPSRHLRSSSDSKILVIPWLKLKTIGERSFSFCGPKTWNSLPKDVRETASLDTFKRQLKTFMFKKLKALVSFMGHLGYSGYTFNASYCHFVILNSFLCHFYDHYYILRLQSFKILPCADILLF